MLDKVDSSKPAVYVLIGNQKRLQPIRGDLIETIKFCIALSRNYNVYYNDMYFNPDQIDYGLYDKEVAAPTRKYDLYYVRANHEMFKILPSPKVLMAYPYDLESFKCASALIVTTGAWKNYLETFNTSETSRQILNKWYSDKLPYLPRIFNIRQYINPWISDHLANDVAILKSRMGFGRIFGYFGRIDNDSLPFVFQNIFPRLQGLHADIELIYAGKLRQGTTRMSPESRYIGQIPFNKVPALTRSSYVNLCNEEIDAEYLGSGKVLDSIGAGIPVLTTKTSVRVEQLGDAYPLYYTDETDCFELSLRLLEDEEFYKKAKESLNVYKKMYEIDAYAANLKECFDSLILDF